MKLLHYTLAAAMVCTLWACSPQAGNSGETPAAISSPTAPPTTEPTSASPTPEGTMTPGATTTPGGTPTPGSDDKYHGLKPFPDVKAPEITQVTRVKMTTDSGDVMIEVYPQAAPNGAKRFLELVNMGFYDNTPIFRVVPGFVVQFGINSKHAKWKDNLFNDDPSLFELEPGTLCFAKAGPNVNSTQVFINYGNNNPLRDQVFTVFGRVTQGMEVAEKWKKAGDPSYGLSQDQLWGDHEGYIKSLPPAQKPNMITKMEVVKQ